MKNIENVGETILLNGQPLSLVTKAGVEEWIEQGVRFQYRYDLVLDPVTATMKYRCLYEKGDAQEPYVLVSNPDSSDGGRVILYDNRPDKSEQAL